MAAFDGFGAGEVSIQWLIRNSGAVSGPRLGLQLARRFFGSLSSFGSLNEYGVSWTSAS